MSTINYNLLRSGLNNALAAIPDDGTIEITVVAYGSSVITVVPPTVLTTNSLATIQGGIDSHGKSGGGTNTSAAITSLTSLMTGSSEFEANTNSIINLATDGSPNSQAATEAAALAAAGAGIDALSIEAIGSGVSSQTRLNNMAEIAFPDPVTILNINETNIPNPLNGSFVVPVSNYDALEDVLRAKVIASVTPNPSVPVPVPSTLLLVLFGALITALRSGRMNLRTAA